MKLNWQGAQAAAKAYVQATQGNTVPDEEIQRRFSICSTCPKRVVTQGVSKVSEVLGVLANRNRVPDAIRSRSCGVCGCSLMLLIPALPQDLHNDSEKERTDRLTNAPDCWILSLPSD